MISRTTGIIVLIGVALGGHLWPESSLRRATTFRGEFAYEFERNDFRPCGSSQRWWLIPASDTLGEELFAALNRVDPVEAGVVRAQHAYVELAGDTTPRGHYGHMGAYDREITVTAILKVQPRGGCKPSVGA